MGGLKFIWAYFRQNRVNQIIYYDIERCLLYIIINNINISPFVYETKIEKIIIGNVHLFDIEDTVKIKSYYNPSRIKVLIYINNTYNLLLNF